MPRPLPSPRSGAVLLGIGLVLCLIVVLTRLDFATSAAASRHPPPRIVPGSAGPRSTARARAQLSRRHTANAAAHWISTWGAAPQGPLAINLSGRGFANQTVRELVDTSVGGSQVRIQLSNAYGTRPLEVGAAAIGIAGPNATIVGGSNRVLSFSGQPSVQIPPGATALSDPIALTVRPLQELSVSLFLPEETGPVTEHDVAKETNYVGTGNRVAQIAADGLFDHTQSWYLLDAVDVLAPPRDIGAIVALGDSITDGVGSQPNTNTRWPNELARRFNARRGSVLSVVDEGIGGNRVLNNAICCGSGAVARFQRDVAARAGVREVILLEGVNDIGYSEHKGALTAPHTDVSADQIIAGYEQIIAQAHADGLKIFGATLTPFQGARYWTPAGEAKREAVNHWILTSGAFDGVIDFAKVLADPTNPEMMDPVYNSGDHLHPNTLGYETMAQAINISALARDAG